MWNRTTRECPATAIIDQVLQLLARQLDPIIGRVMNQKVGQPVDWTRVLKKRVTPTGGACGMKTTTSALMCRCSSA